MEAQPVAQQRVHVGILHVDLVRLGPPTHGSVPVAGVHRQLEQLLADHKIITLDSRQLSERIAQFTGLAGFQVDPGERFQPLRRPAKSLGAPLVQVRRLVVLAGDPGGGAGRAADGYPQRGLGRGPHEHGW